MKRTLRDRGNVLRAALLAAGLVLAGCSGPAPDGGTTSGEGSAELDPAPTTGGREMYTYYCAKCHGISGLGDGPSVGSLRSQSGMNLTILGNESDEEILDTIAQGKGTDMPPWELRLSPEQRKEILGYIRQLKK